MACTPTKHNGLGWGRGVQKKKIIVYSVSVFEKILCELWDHWAHCGIFENGVLHTCICVLEGINNVANFITSFEESQGN